MAVDDEELLTQLAELEPPELELFMLELDGDEFGYVERLLAGQQISDVRDYSPYRHDPRGFVHDVLRESTWSKQDEIMRSVVENKRTAVKACHGPGKSHIAARIVSWWGSVWPVGTAKIITTASVFRQVRNVLWPHIRRVHRVHGLPGETNQVEWKIDGEIVGYGFSARDTDPEAVQGEHATHLLLVVDEAGGISHALGSAFTGLATDTGARVLVIGNPPTDDEDTWFERLFSSELWHAITISAYDTPNFTGELTGWCGSCPPEVEAHRIASHLVDQSWVNDVISEFGEDSAYVIARVHARFPELVANKTIPVSWVEAVLPQHDADSGELVWDVEPVDSVHVKLGVDVAADGGDELVVAQAVGYECSIVHKSAGRSNAKPHDVAGYVLEPLRSACELQAALNAEHGTQHKVRLKIDAIGIGWGVAGILEAWVDEFELDAEIVPVNVGERAADPEKYANQRAEMWWNMRELIAGRLVGLNIDRRCVAQLSGPLYHHTSNGRIAIEKKSKLKERGLPSPDRAEAVSLTFYEPPVDKPKKRKVRLLN
jgi:hypothetical protein